MPLTVISNQSVSEGCAIVLGNVLQLLTSAYMFHVE